MAKENDSFDYLSLLANGFSGSHQDNQKKSFITIDIDDNTDSESDSNDCLIMDPFRKNSSEDSNKTVENDFKSINVKEEVKKEVVEEEGSFSEDVENELLDYIKTKDFINRSKLIDRKKVECNEIAVQTEDIEFECLVERKCMFDLNICQLVIYEVCNEKVVSINQKLMVCILST